MRDDLPYNFSYSILFFANQQVIELQRRGKHYPSLKSENSVINPLSLSHLSTLPLSRYAGSLFFKYSQCARSVSIDKEYREGANL
jgi:hypothetical protein